MKGCTGKPAEDRIEPYLAGTLSDAEAQAFEEHYFACPECLARLRAMQAVERQLRANPVKVRSVLAWPRVAGTLAAAAVLVVALTLGYRAMQHGAGPKAATNAVGGAAPAKQTAGQEVPGQAAATVIEMADLSLPAFRASSLRDGTEDRAFEAGMSAYAKGDCTGAAERLAQVPARSEYALSAKFYLGACQMQQKKWDAAAATLRSVTAKGESPQQEAALYSLAQIALARNDAATAHRYLRQTIALQGDFAHRAAEQDRTVLAVLNRVGEGSQQ